MHLKRHQVPKNWPIKRKGTLYVVRPNSRLSNGIPILIALRDVLKLAQNRNDVKKIISNKQILLNGFPVKDEKNSLSLFDVLTIVPSKEIYKLTLSEKGKFVIEKADYEKRDFKICKVVNKKILKGKKVQLNLSDGRNFISNISCKVNDSVLVNLNKKKIDKCLPLKEKARVLVFAGKHSGKKAKISKLDLEKKTAELDYKEGKINVLIKQLMVIEENE